MNILVVAATREEISGVISGFGGPILDSGAANGFTGDTTKQNNSEIEHSKPEILITGVGMTATAFALGRHLATNQYDLAINLGIAGSFDRNIALGNVVEVVEDAFTELGAEDDSRFITLDQLGFGRTIYKTAARVTNYMPGQNLWQVTAATVNTVHGEEASIAKLHQRTAPQLESMEGAAFFYACEQAGVPALQIRAVSNYVEKRNREAWKIGLAVKNLNTFAAEFLRAVGKL
ncbi:futalosine hydrolase [Mucilaginibacter aquatilis]|uniref:Futalosine hydrolase n=1 Tax=Mucilaginibacter aquatilis TaxID=1517760 RepID=A0A6I4IF92_9SPHI|nr:futalosine hydrolase [Mucilaginibacter aquatilis]MVN92256.1 futalosine hydrolase [Mucilaginibacter aquatilis]